MLTADQVKKLLDRFEDNGKTSAIPKTTKDKLKLLAEELLTPEEFNNPEELEDRFQMFIMLGGKL